MDALDPHIFLKAIPRSPKGWRALGSGALSGGMWAALVYVGVRLLLASFPEGSSSWVEAIAVIGTVAATSWIGLRQSKEALEREKNNKREELRSSAFSIYYALMRIYSRQLKMKGDFVDAHAAHAVHTEEVKSRAAATKAAGIEDLNFLSQFLRPLGNIPSKIEFEVGQIEKAFLFGGGDLGNALGALDDRYNAVVDALQTYSTLWMKAIGNLSGDVEGETATGFSNLEEGKRLKIQLARLDGIAHQAEAFLTENVDDTFNAMKLLLKSRALYFKESVSIEIVDPSGNKLKLSWNSFGEQI